MVLYGPFSSVISGLAIHFGQTIFKPFLSLFFYNPSLENVIKGSVMLFGQPLTKNIND